MSVQDQTPKMTDPDAPTQTDETTCPRCGQTAIDTEDRDGATRYIHRRNGVMSRGCTVDE